MKITKYELITKETKQNNYFTTKIIKITKEKIINQNINHFEIQQEEEQEEQEEKEEEEEEERRINKNHLNNFQSIITIIKCAVGGGSFSLPYAYQLGGLYSSFLFTLFLGYICYYTIDSLFYCERKYLNIYNNNHKNHTNISNNMNDNINNNIRSDNQLKSKLSYAEIGKIAFPQLKIKIQNIEINYISLLIDIGIFSTCVGVCVAYIDIVASIYPSILSFSSYSTSPSITTTIPIPIPPTTTTLNETFISSYYNSSLFPSYSPTIISSSSLLNLFSTSPLFSRWILIVFLIPLCLISNYRYLVTTSTIGSFAVYFGLFIIIINGIIFASKENSSFSFEDSQTIIHIHSFSQFISRTCFLFAIHIVILPIAQEMSRPSYFSFHQVICISYSTIAISNALFGGIVYILYASTSCPLSSSIFTKGPCPNILDSISNGNLIKIVKLLICIDLLFSIPLIISSAREMIISIILSFTSHIFSQKQINLFVRIFIPFFLLILSSTIPDFTLVIDLVGGICNSLMGFILPPLFLLKLHYKENWFSFPYQKYSFRWYLYLLWNTFLILFGIYLIILTIGITITS